MKKRIDLYYEKQQKISERQKERDVFLQQEMRQRRLRLIEKEKKCIEAKRKNETIIGHYRKKILEKINSTEEKIKKQQECNTRNSIERFIEISMRKEDIENNIEQNEKAMEYLRLQRLDEIEMKNKRVEEMKQQKIELMEEKKRMMIELQRSKEKMILKLELLKKTNKYKDRNQIFNELFDENKDNNIEESNEEITRQLKHDMHDRISLIEKAQNLQNSNEGDFEFMTNGDNKSKKTIVEMINEELINNEVVKKE